MIRSNETLSKLKATVLNKSFYEFQHVNSSLVLERLAAGKKLLRSKFFDAFTIWELNSLEHKGRCLRLDFASVEFTFG